MALKKTTELKHWLEKLYVEKYHLPKPRITTVKDGVYIHSGENFLHTSMEAKLFVNIADYEISKNAVIQYIENVDDNVIHTIEKGCEK